MRGCGSPSARGRNRLPAFLVIGAAKAATSSLRGLLNRHSRVQLAEDGRETRFFADDQVFAQGVEWYASMFSNAPEGAVLGECSNAYTRRDRYPRAAERIAQHLPDSKLIYMVRDPLPRIASFWTQIRSHGGEQVHHEFPIALRRDRELLVESSNYWRQLEPYRCRFADSQIKILFFEDFAIDPDKVMRDVYGFIGVEPVDLEGTAAHRNSSTGKRGAPPWLSRLRGSPVYRFARAALPAGFRAPLRKRLLHREISVPQWAPDTREWVLDQLRDDSLRLLAYCGRTPTLWTLE